MVTGHTVTKQGLTLSVMSHVYGMLRQDSSGQARQMFDKMDKDNDGKITQEEFIR